MAWIEIINEREADGRLKSIYEVAVKRAGRVFDILKLQSQSPAALEASMRLYKATMREESPLTRGQREMLAVVVSKINGCHY